jgi:hypothetical protein
MATIKPKLTLDQYCNMAHIRSWLVLISASNCAIVNVDPHIQIVTVSVMDSQNERHSASVMAIDSSVKHCSYRNIFYYCLNLLYRMNAY